MFPHLRAFPAADNTVHVSYSNNKESWDGFVTEINKRLNRLDIQFSFILDEMTGKEMYALVSVVDIGVQRRSDSLP